MGVTSWVKLTDNASTTPLFGGNSVYVPCNTVDIGGGLLISRNPKILKDTAFLTSETGTSKYQDRWDRLKSQISFNGYEETIITLTGVWKPTLGLVSNEGAIANIDVAATNAAANVTISRDYASSTSSTVNSSGVFIFSPNRLMTIVNNPRTLHLYDSVLAANLVNSGANNDTNRTFSYYTTNGIPVVLRTWSLNRNREGDIIEWSMEFVEDKELS